MISISSFKSKNSSFTLKLGYILFAILCLAPRWDGLYFPGKYLWAEDGTVFVNQLIDLNLGSIITPYMGYLLIYPRLVMLLASLFDFVYWPFVMLLGWLFSYLILVDVIVRLGRQLNFSIPLVFVLIAIISLQPSNGEVFFNLTNSQWMLGAAYSLLVVNIFVLGDGSKPSVGTIFFMLLCGLTGPFSIVLFGFAITYLMLDKKGVQNLNLILVLFVCAAVQFFFLIDSSRAIIGAIDLQLIHWIRAFFKLAFFGKNGFLNFIAFFFWILIIFLLYSDKVIKYKFDYSKLALWLLFSASLFLLAGEYASKNDPMAIVNSSGHRYTWIPYVLIFFAVVTLTKKNRVWANLLVFIILFFICIRSIEPKQYVNYQFKSFANFSNYRNLIIPIEPSSKEFPGWHIKKLGSHDVPLSTVEFSIEMLDVKVGKGIISIYTPKISCQNSSDIGLEINIWREQEGDIKIYWSQNKKFKSDDTLSRYYPEGNVSGEFAFPSGTSNFVRVDIGTDKFSYKIENIKIYCLH